MIPALVAVLSAVLLGVIAGLVWQEARRRGSVETAPVYVIEDAVRHVVDRLPPDAGLRTADVRRIIEWEVYQLQGLAQGSRRKTVDVVAGGTEDTVMFIVDRIAETHGVSYAPDQVASVLALEAHYLGAIGAVGSQVPDASPPNGEETRGGDSR